MYKIVKRSIALIFGIIITWPILVMSYIAGGVIFHISPFLLLLIPIGFVPLLFGIKKRRHIFLAYFLSLGLSFLILTMIFAYYYEGINTKSCQQVYNDRRIKLIFTGDNIKQDSVPSIPGIYTSNIRRSFIDQALNYIFMGNGPNLVLFRNPLSDIQKNGLIIFDIKNNDLVKIIPSGVVTSLVYNDKNKRFYASLLSKHPDSSYFQDKSDILVIDPINFQVISRIHSRKKPISLTIDEKNNTLIVLIEPKAILQFFDLNSFKLIKEINLSILSKDRDLKAYQVELYNGLIYMSTWGGKKSFFIVDPEKNNILKSDYFGWWAYGFYIDYYHDTIYLTIARDEKVVVLDATTLEVKHKLPTMFYPNRVIVDKARGLLYVSHLFNGYMNIYALKDYQLLDSLFFGEMLRNIFLHPRGSLFASSKCGFFELLSTYLNRDDLSE